MYKQVLVLPIPLQVLPSLSPLASWSSGISGAALQTNTSTRMSRELLGHAQLSTIQTISVSHKTGVPVTSRLLAVNKPSTSRFARDHGTFPANPINWSARKHVLVKISCLHRVSTDLLNLIIPETILTLPETILDSRNYTQLEDLQLRTQWN